MCLELGHVDLNLTSLGPQKVHKFGDHVRHGGDGGGGGVDALPLLGHHNDVELAVLH